VSVLDRASPLLQRLLRVRHAVQGKQARILSRSGCKVLGTATQSHPTITCANSTNGAKRCSPLCLSFASVGQPLSSQLPVLLQCGSLLCVHEYMAMALSSVSSVATALRGAHRRHRARGHPAAYAAPPPPAAAAPHRAAADAHRRCDARSHAPSLYRDENSSSDD
jgi:hypothetical protein